MLRAVGSDSLSRFTNLKAPVSQLDGLAMVYVNISLILIMDSGGADLPIFNDIKSGIGRR